MIKTHAHNFLFILPLAMIFSSCQKEEIPVAPVKRGDAVTSQVTMGADYGQQIWFDFGTNTAVKTNNKMVWDIGFDCSLNNFIYLNTSRGMQAAVTNETDFSLVTSATGLVFKPDHNSGDTDSLGLRDCVAHGKVCVIDLGFNALGIPQGYRKFQVTGYSNNVYTVRYANLNGSDDHTVQVTKNPQYNFQAYSFSTHQTLAIEPPKDGYDIVFTQYMYSFYNPYTTYLVTGVLINRSQTQVAVIPNGNFTNLKLEDVSSLTFTDSLDAVGYEWKVYNFGTAMYEIHPERVYVIKDAAGDYFKLHFIDFYDAQGIKGAPKFEFQRL